MPADTLSDVLRAVRLTGAVFFTVDAGDPWVAGAPPAEQIGPTLLPESEHVISYHLVTAGRCFGALLDGPPVELGEGDVVVFPHGDAHTMSSAPGLRSAPDGGVYRGLIRGQLPSHLVHGSGPDRIHLICGFLGCDERPFNPLLAALPRMLVSRTRPGDDGALASLARLALRETREPGAGSQGVLARVSELLFVEVVRQHLAGLGADDTGWLAGLRDPFVGRALAELHARPEHAWGLPELARAAGLSRSALAERFTALVGRAPMQYLAGWRMQLAAGLLGEGSRSVAEVAARVGYGSEAAFSRAFKKALCASPAAWRRQRAARRV
jgi:AraC-like DNA-binding protein